MVSERGLVLLQNSVADQTAAQATDKRRLWDVIHEGTVGGMLDGEAWRAWLRASMPDTFKEVWNMIMMALILYFLVNIIDALALLKYQQLRKRKTA